jgi:Bax protein
MNRPRSHARTLLAAGALLLAGGGVLGAGLAAADGDQTEFPARPNAELRQARAVVLPPAGAIEALARTSPRRLRAPDGHVGAVPPPVDGPPDFAAIRDVQRKKLRFFSYLLPKVQRENERLRDLRRRLGYIRDHLRWQRPLDAEDVQWLCAVAAEFRLRRVDPISEEFWETLLRRVDVLPVELVLVQAANESAWGTSRFAREGNNYFGQWCFRTGCGIVPWARPEGATYEVARFDSVEASVGSYMRNINSGRSYRKLRRIRAELRAQGREPTGADLAPGLKAYSERGEVYVEVIRAMLRHNEQAIAAARSRLTLAESSS